MAGIDTSTGAIVPSPSNTGADVAKGGSVAKPTSESVKSSGNKQTQSKISEYIEGSLQVIPNCNYNTGDVYKITGVGNIFSGDYYVSKVTHSISDVYSVNLEVTQVQQATINVASTITRNEPVKQASPKAPDNPKYTVITIKKGDTLGALAKKYKTTVQELAKINGIKNPNLIRAGAPLKVPS